MDYSLPVDFPGKSTAFSDIYTHTHIYIAQEYYSVIKKNEIMPFAATWRDLEIIISK